MAGGAAGGAGLRAACECDPPCREDLWVREGKILNPEKLFFDEKGSADIQLDCKGSIIAPGFIDVQINGKAKPRACARKTVGPRLVCPCSSNPAVCALPATKRVSAGHQGDGSH